MNIFTHILLVVSVGASTTVNESNEGAFLSSNYYKQQYYTEDGRDNREADLTARARKSAVLRNKRTNAEADVTARAGKSAVLRNKRAYHVADQTARAEKWAVLRIKRANPVIDLTAYAARKAVQKLLSGTTQTGDGNLLRTYIKYAKNKQYLKDFESLRPSNVYEKTYENGVIDRSGVLGDRFVFATTNGPNNIPILEIQSYIKVDGVTIPSIDRITYVE